MSSLCKLHVEEPVHTGTPDTCNSAGEVEVNKDDGVSFDTTLEQRLLSAHQDWLAARQEFMVSWNQTQDAILIGNVVMTIGLTVVCAVLVHRVNKLERGSHVGH